MFSKLWPADRVLVLYLILLSLLLTGISSFAQKRKEVKEGVIHIKVSEAMVRQLERSRFSRNARSELTTGIESIDKVNQKFKVTNMKRLFAPGGKFEEKHRKYGLHRWYVVEMDNNTSVYDALPDFKSMIEIEKAEPVYVKAIVGSENKNFGPAVVTKSYSALATLPANSNDPLLPDQWHYRNEGQTDGTVSADIDLLRAWQLETGSPEVVVSIHDGGIDLLHEDLQSNIWQNINEVEGNGIDDDNNGYVDDVHGFNFAENVDSIPAHDHGTHVGGTVAAITNNEIGVAGVAGGSGSGDGVRIMSCAIFTEMFSGGFENSYIYAADNGAIISQNSWGYLSPDFFEGSILEAIDYFIAEAGKDASGNQVGPMNGGIVIFAAGNSNSGENYYPGYYSPVLAVASTNHHDRKSWYSNYGAWVDIAAPGGETDIQQQGVLSTLPGNQYGYFQGTSMACPHVSGVAALLVSKYGRPGYTPALLRERLLSTAKNIDLVNPEYRTLLGQGRLEAYDALQINDEIPPLKINDLEVINASQDSVTLSWTAPVDAGEGAARIYDLRYSTAPITADNFNEATRVENMPDPLPAGERELFSVKNLSAATTYYFMIRSADSNSNFSALSNVVNVKTLFPPASSINPHAVSKKLLTGESGTANLVIINDGQGHLYFNFDIVEDSVKYVRPPDINGHVAPHDSTVVQIPFNAEELPGGTYVANLLLNTNDPEHKQFVIPATLQVENNGKPIASLPKSSLDFGNVFIGGSTVLSYTVKNSGSENLIVQSIDSDNNEFTANTSLPWTIPAFQSRSANVTYSPNALHASEGSITLHTNDLISPLLTLQVEGNGTEAPVIEVLPGEINSTLYRNKVETQNLKIVNSGGSDLDYSIEVPAAEFLITIDSIAGAVPPHEDRTIKISIDASGLAPGQYSSFLTIKSNTLENDSINVPISLTVLESQLSVTPASLNAEVLAGDSVTRTIYLRNNGIRETSFRVSAQGGNFLLPAGANGIEQASVSSPSFDAIAFRDATEKMRSYTKTGERFSTDILRTIAGLRKVSLASGTLYATDFEDFDIGDANQKGWSGSTRFNVETTNPFSGAKHLRVTSIEGAGHYITSPYGTGGTELFSSYTAKISVDNLSAIAEILPVSSTSVVNSAIQFWYDGTIFILVDDGNGFSTWETIDEPVPDGYFDLTIEIERSTLNFKVYFDDREVFHGKALGPDIIWTYSGVSAHGSGTVFDMDDFQIIDGKKQSSSYVSFSPHSGTIAAGDSTEVSVQIDASELFSGEYLTDIVIYNEGDKLTVPLSLTVTGDPEITFSPTDVQTGADYMGRGFTNLFVSNTGNAPLRYEMSVLDSITGDIPSWLSISLPEEGVIYPGESKEVDLNFDAANLESGMHYAKIKFNSNDSVRPEANVLVSFHVLTPAKILLAKDSIQERLYVGASSRKQVEINNEGESRLDYSFLYFSGDDLNEARNNTSRKYPENYPLKKGEMDTRIGHPVMTGEGGPDLGGYRWRDSEEEGGPIFQWVDISHVGIGVSLGDDDFITASLPFAFNFYGIDYSLIQIGSNGILTFDGDASWYSNMEIPDQFDPNNFIAPLWDDMTLIEGGTMHYKEFPDKFVIQYTDVPLYRDVSQTATFEVILYPDGQILLQYLQVDDGTSATVGIENLDGSSGLQVAFNTDYLHQDLAVLFSPAPVITWIKPNPMSGSIYFDESQMINLDFNAEGLEVGEFNTTLNILSNDPERRISMLNFTLTVFDNYAPLIDSLADSTVVETEILSLSFTASDRDDPEVSVRLVDPPAFFRLTGQSNGMATYSIEPLIGQSGLYELQIEAVDSRGEIAHAIHRLFVIPYGVESFSLVDSRTNQVVKTFTDSATLNRADPDFSYYVLKANTNPSSVGSVEFRVDGKHKNGTKDPPYILEYELDKLRLGTHSVRAMSFTEKNQKGQRGKGLTAVVQVINDSGLPDDPTEPGRVEISVLFVYPNPVYDELMIKVWHEPTGNVEVTIIDGTGNPVLRKAIMGEDLNNYRMDVSSLISGIYYLQVTTGSGKKSTIRILKR